MDNLDWVIIGLYLVAAVGIGVCFTKKAGRSTADFFVAGRSLGWFIAGTSIVATTFSSDTPLVVAGISRQTGIHGHWFWLSLATGQIATVFFFARLWRRTEAMTDIEFIIQRYQPSKATSTLRVFKVFFDGVLINCIVMGSVTLAMAKIIKALLHLPDVTLFHFPLLGDVNYVAIVLFILAATALLYSALSGLYGVVYTDLLQFVLAMLGSVGLAAYVYFDASTGDGLIKKLAAAPEFKTDFLDFFPDLSSFNLVTFTFLVYVCVTWWARAPGNGYYVQRLLATRSEKDSVLAFLWFNVCQYVVRPWPWIIVGLLSLHYLPHLKDPESSFPMMIDVFLPAGLKGIMVASLLAAFMSTIDTHLNWGASYIINDFYKPFINPGKNAKHYVFVSRIGMVMLMMAALLVTTRLSSVLGAYKYLGVMFGSIGTVMIARWYWWRVNPYSEIAAIVASLIVANYLQIVLPSTPGADLFAVRVVLTITVVTAVWVLVTFLTSKQTPDPHTLAFYTKMRIPGPGWKKVSRAAGVKPIAGEFTQNLIAWLLCVVFIFSATLGLGKFILLQWKWGLIYLVAAIVAGCALRRTMRSMSFM
ncbi:MAG TPA: sodium:solute symporter family protein [Sedimentisphaerales bacterium]|nr:sodium:solute symporter family protein [Sedimentisphaerales bacterium]